MLEFFHNIPPSLASWPFLIKRDLFLLSYRMNDEQAYQIITTPSDPWLAYASPSNKIAIVSTGLVIDCLGTNNFLVWQQILY